MLETYHRRNSGSPRVVVGRLGRHAAIVALLVVVDLAVSLPIMGATYRPFSWMSIAPADAATLYPVIRNVSFDGDTPSVSVAVIPGGRVVLQCSTNLLDAAGWCDAASTMATGQEIRLIDTNRFRHAVYYRVKQIFGGTP